MKKIDKLILDAFLGPFLITFLVVVFILLNINMLKYFDDIIGKGLDGWTLGQLFFYFAIFTIPTALPLAVLLSSLISFGNLGEHFELTAIKAAGISLLRALQPIFFFVLMLTAVAFYANNYWVPKAALEAYSLLYDIKHKKPAFDLREGAFYNGIDEISIKVDKKFPDGVTLKNVIIYDHRKNDGNNEVTVADSGKMYSILGDRYLKLELFRGYNYTEGASEQRAMAGKKSKNSESMSRSQFSKTQVIFDLSSFEIKRTNKEWFQGNRQMRNMDELDVDIDSIKDQVTMQWVTQYYFHQGMFNYYAKTDTVPLRPELKRFKAHRDSMDNEKYHAMTRAHAETVTDSMARESKKDSSTVTAQQDSTGAAPGTAVVKKDSVTPLSPPKKLTPPPHKSRIAAASNDRPDRTERLDQGRRRDKPKKDKIEKKPEVAVVKAKKILSDSAIAAKLDSVYAQTPDAMVYQSAGNAARQMKSQLSNSNIQIENFEKEGRVFEIQWHKIIASSFACIAMFLIGAPLGAIIKKGGLGVPFLVSILFFIVYYVMTMQGEKLAKQGTVSVIVGVWMADIILFAVGLFFLKQARADARLFEADFYSVAVDKLRKRFKREKPAPVSV